MLIFLIILFYLSVFFPYIEILKFGTDTQPYALVLSIILGGLYLFETKKINKKVLPLLFLVLISSSIVLYNGLNKTVIRSLANYYSLFFITYATYVSLKMNNKIFSEFFVKSVTNIWLIVGLIQKTVMSNFLYDLISRNSTTLSRGNLSLAPEPTYYGIICVFLLLIIITKIKKHKFIYILNCVFQIIFIAQSSMSILFLIILLSYYVVIKLITVNNIKAIIYTFFLSIFSILGINYAIVNFLRNTRVYYFYSLILSNPIKMFLNDASANDRLSHIYFSIKGFFENYFIPNGYLYWPTYLNNSLKNQELFFWVSVDDRIMSGLGAALFELGIFGLLIPLSIIYIIWSSKEPLDLRLTYILFLITILFTAIPLAHPYIGFILGLFLYNSKRRLKYV